MQASSDVCFNPVDDLRKVPRCSVDHVRARSAGRRLAGRRSGRPGQGFGGTSHASTALPFGLVKPCQGESWRFRRLRASEIDVGHPGQWRRACAPRSSGGRLRGQARRRIVSRRQVLCPRPVAGIGRCSSGHGGRTLRSWTVPGAASAGWIQDEQADTHRLRLDEGSDPLSSARARHQVQREARSTDGRVLLVPVGPRRERLCGRLGDRTPFWLPRLLADDGGRDLRGHVTPGAQPSLFERCRLWIGGRPHQRMDGGRSPWTQHDVVHAGSGADSRGNGPRVYANNTLTSPIEVGWQHHHEGSAGRRVLEHHATRVRFGNRPGNGQPQTGTARTAIQTDETLENTVSV